MTSLCLAATTLSYAAEKPDSPIDQRLVLTRSTDDNPFAIAAYKSNYLLPVTVTSNPTIENAQHAEVKFQFSMSIPVWREILGTRAFAAFGYTNQSYWQAYNRNLSSPFTETNHEPELLLFFPYHRRIAGFTHKGMLLGFSHQSNGRTPPFSRSWNRIYTSFVFERKQSYYSLKIWQRVPEEEKEDIMQPDGDDNPDIEEYMGNFELSATFKRGNHRLSAVVRHNLSASQRGAIQLDYGFPISDSLSFTAQFFTGYGESMITYNEKVSRIGIGFRLSNGF